MSENREIYDITIIGGGPVGLFAAFYAGLRGVSVKIIESLSELGGQPAVLYPEKMIYDVAGFPGITAADLTENLIKQLDRFKDSTAICLKEEVKTFEKDGDIFTIETNKGQHFSHAIVIACGNGAFAPRTRGLEVLDFQHQIKTLKIGMWITNVQVLRFHHYLKLVKKVFTQLVMRLIMKVRLI